MISPSRGARRNFEHLGNARGFGDQRVVASRLKILGHAAEHSLAVVLHRRDLAVHEPRGAHHFAAEHLHHRLMTQAHAEDRYASGERFESSAIETPASRGVPGPGEITRCVWLCRKAASTVMASLRCTSTSAPNIKKACTRL